MDIGIGLPNTIIGTPGRLLVDWAVRAEERGFSSVATIGRIAYPSYEELTLLAAAGAATERIGLFTDVLLAPTRSAVLLAKEAASVDQLSGGRLTLGLAVGARPEDYEAVERPYEQRGRDFDEALDTMQRVWAQEILPGLDRPVGPATTRGRIPILIGGRSEAAIRRAAATDGYTSGSAPPSVAGPMYDQVRAAWARAGRVGEPRLAALTYFSLGDNEATSIANIEAYYGAQGRGAELARRVARTPDAIRATVQAYAELGVHELLIFPTVADLDQVDALADVVLA